MMKAVTLTGTLVAVLALGACANSPGLTGTGTTSALPAKAAAADPACATLASQIQELRKDGVVDRASAAAQGKSSTVAVKRASLGQLAQLDKANAEFQAKCSTLPGATTAAVKAPAPAAAKVAAANAAPDKAKAAVAAEAAKAKAASSN